jgi:hypothetical protein
MTHCDCDWIMKTNCSPALAGPTTLVNRLHQSLNEAAFRLGGKDIEMVDEAMLSLVIEDLQRSFLGTLSVAELTELGTELERIAFGDDIVAMDEARRPIAAHLDETGKAGLSS